MSDPNTIPGELTAIHDRLDQGEQRMARIEFAAVAAERRMKRMEEQLSDNGRAIAENTDMTRDVAEKQSQNAALLVDIKDAVTFGRVGSKLLKWVGAMTTAAASIWALIYLFTHGGRPPP